MKIAFALALALLALLPATSWSDAPPPRPTIVTFPNLTAFPKFKFSYGVALSEEQPPKKFHPLSKRIVVSIPTAGASIHLFVEDGNGERSDWASIPVKYTGTKQAVSILDVQREGKEIKVNYKMDPDPASQKESGMSGSPALPFALSGVSLGAIVILTRRKRAASSGR
jgi:hypothetical protein